ncbi:hypothetical protein [Bacillus cereus]
MKSILSYKERGNFGKSSWPGNCSGFLIRDLLLHFRPRKFVEVFSGSGTGKDVAVSLGITNSIHLDLVNGWNALQDEIPTGMDFCFSHPAYWDIIDYNRVRKEDHKDDLSNNMSYDEFIHKLNKVNAKIYQALLNGGRHALLIGDVRKKGKYYSLIKDIAWIGDIESHIIKQQFNTFSSRKNYKGSFIPIEHEHLLIFKKNSVWDVSIKITKTQTFNLKQFENMTWRDLIQACLEQLGGYASLTKMYEVIKDTKKAQKNKHWKEKIRQTLQIHKNFEAIDRGVWQLKIA